MNAWVQRLRVTGRSSRVSITAGEGPGFEVDGGRVVTAPDGTLEVEATSAVTVRCPTGCDVTVASASGKVELIGAFGAVRVSATSGSVTIGDAQDVEVRAMSGRVVVGHCAGRCSVVAHSGKVRIASAERAEVTAQSGSVEVGLTTSADIRAVSGTVGLGTTMAPHVHVQTTSGSVAITVPAGAMPRATLQSSSGSVRCGCSIGGDGELDVKTRSGSITVLQG